MKVFYALLALVTLNLITTHALSVSETEREWYGVGGMALIVSEEESLNVVFRVGAGLQINERFGLELFWDSAPGIEPRNLIQKADLPMTIVPLQIDVRSHSYRYLTVMGVVKYSVKSPFTVVCKAGLAQHRQEIEFDVSTAGNIFKEGMEVSDSTVIPAISGGMKIVSTRLSRLSLGFSTTYYFDKGREALLFTASAKLKI